MSTSLTEIPKYFKVLSEPSEQPGRTMLSFESEAYSTSTHFDGNVTALDVLNALTDGKQSGVFAVMLKRLRFPSRFELIAGPHEQEKIRLTLTINHRGSCWIKDKVFSKPKLQTADMVILVQWLSQAQTLLQEKVNNDV